MSQQALEYKQQAFELDQRYLEMLQTEADSVDAVDHLGLLSHAITVEHQDIRENERRLQSVAYEMRVSSAVPAVYPPQHLAALHSLLCIIIVSPAENPSTETRGGKTETPGPAGAGKAAAFARGRGAENTRGTGKAGTGGSSVRGGPEEADADETGRDARERRLLLNLPFFIN